eukprot:sb/3472981/
MHVEVYVMVFITLNISVYRILKSVSVSRTAAVQAGVPVTYTDILVEGAPCQPVPEPEYWKPEPWEFNQDGARIEAAFKKYVHRAHPSQKEDSHEVIVCHGNVIRYIVCRALQFDPEGWLRMSLANCSVTHITIRPNGNVGLRGLGEKGHLTPDKMTYN